MNNEQWNNGTMNNECKINQLNKTGIMDLKP